VGRPLRYLLLLISAIQIFFTVVFYFRLPLAMQLWPLGYTNNLSYIFVSSIFAAAAASTLWCIAANEPGALAGIALDYIVILVPVTIFAFQSSMRSGAMLLFGIVCLLAAIFGLGLFRWSVRIPIRDTRPMPRLVRLSFVGFIIALLIVGGSLILKTPNILPWNVNVAGSVVYGWFFLGAALYFAYGLLRPSWHNAAGQLTGFLAYDLILIVPFLQYWPVVPPNSQGSLIIYLGVILISSLLAIYYLLINIQTRQIAPSIREQAL
jgi:hypothetical protein